METTQSGMIPMRKKTIYIIAGCAMTALLIVSIVMTFSFGLFSGDENYFKLTIAVVGMLFAAILFACCCFNIQDPSHQGDIFAAVSVLLYFCLLFSGAMDALAGKGVNGSTIMALNTITSACSTAVHFLFWRYQCTSLPESRARRYFTRWIYGLILIYLAVLAINPFTGVLFTVDASGNLISTGETLEILFISLFYLTYLLYTLPQRCLLEKKLSLAAFAVFPMLCIALTTIWYAAGIGSVLSITYIFLLMAAYVVFFGDYIESKKRLLLQKAELAEKERRQTELQTAIMLSQIQPHFLYNALNTISSLCEMDALRARDAIDSFARYLRVNMNSLESRRLVPFSEELEHTRTYLNIEQLRFGEDLQVVYDIGCDDFRLPPLCVQPLAENAVKHGLQRTDGGVVTIRTRREENAVHITVTDNGTGFTPDALISEDNRTHVGIENVRARLAAFCSGTLTVHSRPGEGTTAEIILPEESQ